MPGVLYNIAICWDELKEYAKAQEHYLEYLAGSPEISEERKAVVKARLDHFGGFLGSLSIKGADDGTEVWIDGEMVGRTPSMRSS